MTKEKTNGTTETPVDAANAVAKVLARPELVNIRINGMTKIPVKQGTQLPAGSSGHIAFFLLNDEQVEFYRSRVKADQRPERSEMEGRDGKIYAKAWVSRKCMSTMRNLPYPVMAAQVTARFTGVVETTLPASEKYPDEKVIWSLEFVLDEVKGAVGYDGGDAEEGTLDVTRRTAKPKDSVTAGAQFGQGGNSAMNLAQALAAAGQVNSGLSI